MADLLPTKIQLTVVTRERKIVDAEVDEVILPASDGEIGVLPGHTPLLATLRIGQLRYRAGTKVERVVISWGFAEVLPDRVIVLAERGFLPTEIDRVAAEQERAAAEKEMAYLSSHDPEFARVEAKLEDQRASRALVRAQSAERRGQKLRGSLLRSALCAQRSDPYGLRFALSCARFNEIQWIPGSKASRARTSSVVPIPRTISRPRST
jgi:F-type H+-transporting ATPase subunit epsilon